MRSFSDDINSLLPSGYKRLNKLPLWFTELDTVSPIVRHPLIVPFVSAPLIKETGTRVKIFKCLLRASSN